MSRNFATCRAQGGGHLNIKQDMRYCDDARNLISANCHSISAISDLTFYLSKVR